MPRIKRRNSERESEKESEHVGETDPVKKSEGAVGIEDPRV